MPHTRARMLRIAVAFALLKAEIHGCKGVLTEEHRYAIGDHIASLAWRSIEARS